MNMAEQTAKGLCPCCKKGQVREQMCSACDGRGKLSDEWCPDCDGDAYVDQCDNCGWRPGEPIAQKQ